MTKHFNPSYTVSDETEYAFCAQYESYSLAMAWYIALFDVSDKYMTLLIDERSNHYGIGTYAQDNLQIYSYCIRHYDIDIDY